MLRETPPKPQTNPSEYTQRVDENGVPLPKSERRPKKKVACMIGYCGTGYNGMQIQNNPGVKTIEGELFSAFVEAGAISAENADDLKKNGFMRAARTDKGVHAAGNVISCKLIIEDEDILDKINSRLPAQIRIWGIDRTNKLFDCRKMCSSRVYEYLLPTYSLLPPKPKTVLAELISRNREETPGVLRDDAEGEKWWKETHAAIQAQYSGETLAEVQKMLDAKVAVLEDDEDQKSRIFDANGGLSEYGKLVKAVKALENGARRAYRVSGDRLGLFRDAMKQYEGSHNFHNFTLGKHFKDPSARRFMKLTTVSEPFIIEGTEWVSIKIHGQLFMLHQIRKMIAMASLVVRTGCPIGRISDCFGPTKVNIPKAPALGLLLENPVYEGYNEILEKFGYQPIDFLKYQKEMDAFKMKFIYDKIYGEETKENSFYGFFSFIDSFKRDQSEGNEGKHVFDFLGAVFDNGAQTEPVVEDKFQAKDQENVD